MPNTRGIVIDANLLVLLVVGRVSPALITRHRRTRQYTANDFDLLERAVGAYGTLAVTPHVLTEASNLASQYEEPFRGRIRYELATVVATASELALPAREVVRDPLYFRLGLTDAALSLVSAQAAAVITDDLPLWDALARNSDGTVEVINFTHLRFGSL